MKKGFLGNLIPAYRKSRLTLICREADFASAQERILDAEYEPLRSNLCNAGLNEAELRQMDPDDRVAALEQARLDPYDYIYLAC